MRYVTLPPVGRTSHSLHHTNISVQTAGVVWPLRRDTVETVGSDVNDSGRQTCNICLPDGLTNRRDSTATSQCATPRSTVSSRYLVRVYVLRFAKYAQTLHLTHFAAFSRCDGTAFVRYAAPRLRTLLTHFGRAGRRRRALAASPRRAAYRFHLLPRGCTTARAPLWYQQRRLPHTTHGGQTTTGFLRGCWTAAFVLPYLFLPPYSDLWLVPRPPRRPATTPQHPPTHPTTQPAGHLLPAHTTPTPVLLFSHALARAHRTASVPYTRGSRLPLVALLMISFSGSRLLSHPAPAPCLRRIPLPLTHALRTFTAPFTTALHHHTHYALRRPPRTRTFPPRLPSLVCA